MKPLLLTIAIGAFGAAPDRRILNLLTEDTQSILGIDYDRYRSSRLSIRFPVDVEDLLRAYTPGAARVTQLVTIETPDAPPLTVLFGEFGLVPAPPEGESQRLAPPEHGVLFVGDPTTTAAALAAWKNSQAKPPAWAANLIQLGRDYDNWAFLRNPLPPAGSGIAPTPRSHWDDLRKRFVDISVGLRLGARIECFASANMATADDAASAAALARWLPAFTESRAGSEAELVSIIENFDARQNGNNVEIRFSLSESKIRIEGFRVD